MTGRADPDRRPAWLALEGAGAELGRASRAPLASEADWRQLRRHLQQRVLVPEPMPQVLDAALGACVSDLAPATPFIRRPVSALATLPAPSGEEKGYADHHRHAHDEHHNHHPVQDDTGDHEDHEDMMPITGEPSTDGLVMESIKLSLGPLMSPLAAGLVADVVLDGDVVAECSLRTLLRQPTVRWAPGSPPPDPLEPHA